MNMSGWWKGTFALFQMLATGVGVGESGKHLSKGRLLPSHQQARGESFYRQSWAEGWCPSRNSIVISISHLQIIISGLISIILIVLGTVNLQFQTPFVHISLRAILEIVAAHVLGTVWSS